MEVYPTIIKIDEDGIPTTVLIHPIILAPSAKLAEDKTCTHQTTPLTNKPKKVTTGKDKLLQKNLLPSRMNTQ